MNIIKLALIRLIKIYQLVISPYMGNNCRYLPTCSEYFIDCVNEYGILKGVVKGIKRIFSCHPIKILGGGKGFDPVKKKGK